MVSVVCAYAGGPTAAVSASASEPAASFNVFMFPSVTVPRAAADWPSGAGIRGDPGHLGWSLCTKRTNAASYEVARSRQSPRDAKNVWAPTFVGATHWKARGLLLQLGLDL